MNRSFYSNSIDKFLKAPTESILGNLALKNEFTLEQSQRDAWLTEISILKNIL